MLVKKILDWTEEETTNLDPENDSKAYLKAFGLGAIEGLIEGAVLMYVPVLIAAYSWKRKATKDWLFNRGIS